MTLNMNESVEILVQWMEVIVHRILHERRVYPGEAFHERYTGISALPVSYKCADTTVQYYVTSFFKCLSSVMLLGACNNMQLRVIEISNDKQRIPIETYTWYFEEANDIKSLRKDWNQEELLQFVHVQIAREELNNKMLLFYNSCLSSVALLEPLELNEDSDYTFELTFDAENVDPILNGIEGRSNLMFVSTVHNFASVSSQPGPNATVHIGFMRINNSVAKKRLQSSIP